MELGTAKQLVPEFVDQSPSIRRLRSTAIDFEEHRKPNGQPRVITWTVNPFLPHIKPTVIRATRPAWEDFKPMFTMVNKMRWDMIKEHQPYMAFIIGKHRTITEKYKQRAAVAIPTQDDLKAIRIQAHLEWKAQPAGYKVQEILAGSYNASTFRFVARCWSCRSLAPFKIYRQEPDTAAAWAGMDSENKNIENQLGANSAEILVVKDTSKCANCAEWWALAANWKMANPGEKGPSI